MKKQLLVFTITLTTILPMKFILCMDNNGIPQITSSITLSQNDINECTKELKEKYNDIPNIIDHESIRDGILDATIVISQAQDNDTQELLSLRKDLYEQYQKLGKCVHNYDYDSLHGAMNIDNRQKNSKKYEDELIRIRKQDSHQFTLDHDKQKLKDIEYDLRKLESDKEFYLQRSMYAKQEMTIINIMKHVASLNEQK